MSLIDRDELIEVLDRNFYGIGAVEVLKQLIEAQPSYVRECGRDEDGRCKMRACNLCDKYRKQLENRWIPCKERLPIISEDVLCVVKGNPNYVCVGWYEDYGVTGLSKWHNFDGFSIDVIAWQPLPPKYEE